MEVEDTFEGDGYVYGINCGDDFTAVYASPNSLRYRH